MAAPAHSDTVEAIIAARLSERGGRRGEAKRNLKAVLIAIGAIALAILAFNNAGRVLGVSDQGLQSSVAGVVNAGGSCDSVGDGRWICKTVGLGTESGYESSIYAVQETSRGCWEAMEGAWTHPMAAFDEFGTRKPVGSGCLDLADYISGNDGYAPPPYALD